MAALPDEWHAALQLSFLRQEPRKTVLAGRKHEGPLLVQKALYPEGPQVCHVTILHPPSGIAGGDTLSIGIHVGQDAHALLTTPGATRWYKANGRRSAQDVDICIEPGARLDWLPQENIFFEQANARTSTRLHLQTGASAIGWEITQLGSVQKPSHWDEGRILLNTQLSLDGRLLWMDAGELDAGSPLRHTANGLASYPVLATMWAFGTGLTAEQVDGLAQDLPWADTLRMGLTHMPQENGQGLCLVRALGVHAQDVKNKLIELWQRLRPLLLDIDGAPLRLWKT
jgi:urease accessory protein